MIKVINFDSFEEFYNSQLSYNCEFFRNRGEYVYRGTFGDFRLIPKALRDKKAKNRTYGEQQEYEINYLNQFLTFSNANGLKIPNSAMDRNGKLKEVDKDIWLPDEYEELAALAQHYGLPTILLDWSFDIFVSMYFASISAIEAKYNGVKELNENGEEVSTNLIIWACKLDIKKCKSKKGNLETPLSFTVPSYYNNPNLNVQKGVLTVWKIRAVDINEKIEIKSLDNLLKERYHKVGDDILLYKFILPFDSCFEMYDYVDKLNYNAAKLFPGYSGIEKYIREKEQHYSLREIKRFVYRF